MLGSSVLRSGTDRFLSDPDLSGTKHLDPVYKFSVRIRIVFFSGLGRFKYIIKILVKYP